jgi:transposase
VVDYVQRAEAAGLCWPLPADLDDAALEAKLSGQRSSKPQPAARPLPDMNELHLELRKKGVTVQLLWLEYKERFPEGYQYSQFLRAL